MASGCIPVVSRSGGSTEFFQEAVSGFSVPINDQEIDLFCKKIRAITGDSAVRAQMSIAARNEAEKHPWEDVAREYLRALQEASLTE
jgi:glycosyltransferase involved in cell wall biosynthesis